MRTLGLQASLKGWARGWAGGRDLPLSNHTHSPVLGEVGCIVRSSEADGLLPLIALSPSPLPYSWCFLVFLPHPLPATIHLSLSEQVRLGQAEKSP